ncbi:MAG TPA: hypothetical protein VMV82_11235 [Candidatus Dormibacteraeota bacterium]|nr:hypothetical protein [Candidatus Dormibacteraeota bacterium]
MSVDPRLVAGVDDPPAVTAANRGSSNADKLVTVAMQSTTLLRDSERVAYARVSLVGGAKPLYRVRSRDFKGWLTSQFYATHGRTPSAQALGDALGVLEGHALHYAGIREVEVRVRVGGDGENEIALDLGTRDWICAVVTSNGWYTEPHGERCFVRPNGLLPLPMPSKDSDLAVLRDILPCGKDDAVWARAAGAMVGWLHPLGPYYGLNLTGEQGSAKSTFARLLKDTFDPAGADLRAEPRELRDLAIAAEHGHILALDNLSGIRPLLSDGLCRLLTGAAFGTRALYENREEEIFRASKPVILNGIGDHATRGDLLDRLLTIQLPPIPDTERRSERQVRSQFNAQHARILGGLLSAVATMMREIERVRRQLKGRHRMADAFERAIAAEVALGLKAGTFERAADTGRKEAHVVAIESSTVGPWLMKLLDDKREFNGTYGELLNALDLAPPEVIRRSEWPKNARRLRGEITRLAPALRAIGVMVQIDLPRQGRGQPLRLALTPDKIAGTDLHDLQNLQDHKASASTSVDDVGTVDEHALLDEEVLAP